jgi:membrane peptidoglycan carboxypeptidase
VCAVKNPLNWSIRLVVALLAGSLLIAASIVGAAPQAWRMMNAHKEVPVQLPPFSGLATRTRILDVSAQQIGVFEFENSQPLTIDQIPDQVVAALLAVEDSGFEKHKGVNLRALVRATLANFQYSSGRQGASTITQQVVKNEYLAGLPRDGRYKILQARYAVMLEKTVPKREIVQRYLNTVFFGNNAYGVQAAAEVYFGAKVADLTLAQAGFLAGLVRAPSTYDPIRRPEQSRRRFSQVLERLVETQLMTQEDADKTLVEFKIPETVASVPQQSTSRTYFTEMVRDFLLNKSTILGATYRDRFNALYRGGITVTTTLDASAQAKAEKASKDRLPANKTGVQTSMVSLDTTTGALRAIVGGPGFVAGRTEVNLALRRRQTGSSIKMFVLAAALEAGAQASDLIDGTLPCTLPNPGKPEEPFKITQGVSHPVAPLAEQTWLSINCAYARLAQIVGLNRLPGEVYKLASSPYLRPDIFKIQPYASFSTGANELSPMDMASGAQTMANGGIHHEPYFIEKIEGPSGILYQHQAAPVQAMSKESADKGVDILKQTLIKGTARRDPLAGNRPAAGKTGTQDENTNAWFVGFTKQLTTAVWVGDPKAYTPMIDIPEFKADGVSKVTGNTYPVKIWKAFMDAAHEGVPVLNWDAPVPPTRNPVRYYLPGVDCIAEVVSGKLTQKQTGTVVTVVPPSTVVATTVAPTTTKVPVVTTVKPGTVTPTTVPAGPTTTVFKGPIVSVVDPGTTIPPTDLNPLTPITGVDPQKYLVYNCAKGLPSTVKVAGTP